MMHLTKSTLLTVIVIAVFVLVTVEAWKEAEDSDTRFALKGHGSDGSRHHLVRRATEDDIDSDDDDKPHKKKAKKKHVKQATTASPATTSSTTSKAATAHSSTSMHPSTTGAPAEHHTSTTGMPKELSSTTGSPHSTSTTKTPHNKTSTTLSPKDGGDLDDLAWEELEKKKGAEKVLIIKATAAFKEWASFLETHGKKTVNKNRADALFRAIDSLRTKYFPRLARLAHITKPMFQRKPAFLSRDGRVDPPPIDSDD